MEKQSFLSEIDALNYIVTNFENVCIRNCACSCENFNCPNELGNWSGETEGYEVIDNDSYATVAIIAYWRSDDRNEECLRLRKELR